MEIKEFTQRLLAHMGIESAEITVEDSDFLSIQITVSEEDSGLLIGYHGESLAAIQKVLQLIYMRENTDKKIIVNVNDYKERRRAQIEERTVRVAERVLESGRSYVFDYLPANERLIVHETITNTPEFSTLESISTGEGFQRRLEIRIKEDSAE